MKGEVWEDPDIGRPNFHQGFGRFVLSRALPLPGAKFRLQFADIDSESPDALQVGGGKARWTEEVEVASGHPLSVTLAWTDPAGRGLQHELDLVVVSPTGKKHVGNANLRRLPFETFDGRNNVEQVIVTKPRSGPWTVHVSARNTYRGPQGFAIAITYSVRTTAHAAKFGRPSVG